MRLRDRPLLEVTERWAGVLVDRRHFAARRGAARIWTDSARSRRGALGALAEQVSCGLIGAACAAPSARWAGGGWVLRSPKGWELRDGERVLPEGASIRVVEGRVLVARRGRATLTVCVVPSDGLRFRRARREPGLRGAVAVLSVAACAWVLIAGASAAPEQRTSFVPDARVVAWVATAPGPAEAPQRTGPDRSPDVASLRAWSCAGTMAGRFAEARRKRTGAAPAPRHAPGDRVHYDCAFGRGWMRYMETEGWWRPCVPDGSPDAVGTLAVASVTTSDGYRPRPSLPLDGPAFRAMRTCLRDLMRDDPTFDGRFTIRAGLDDLRWLIAPSVERADGTLDPVLTRCLDVYMHPYYGYALPVRALPEIRIEANYTPPREPERPPGHGLPVRWRDGRRLAPRVAGVPLAR